MKLLPASTTFDQITNLIKIGDKVQWVWKGYNPTLCLHSYPTNGAIGEVKGFLDNFYVNVKWDNFGSKWYNEWSVRRFCDGGFERSDGFLVLVGVDEWEDDFIVG